VIVGWDITQCYDELIKKMTCETKGEKK
jgi:hypothetical protein